MASRDTSIVAKNNSAYKFKTPERFCVICGAIGACFIPVLLGLWVLIPRVEAISNTCNLMTDFENWNDCAAYDYEIAFGLTFIFATPCAAWLAIRRLRKAYFANNLVRFYSPISAGILSATFMHAISAIIFFIVIIGSGYLLNELIYWHIIFIFIFHLMLWVFITLPLSALCAVIFSFVALRSINPK